MLKSNSFLALDFGAGTLKVGEFDVTEAGTLSLSNFGVRALGPEAAQEAAREAALVQAIKALLAERGFTARNINVCAPGFSVFSKFVKLPPVDTAKVQQIIQYEAQQNVPFPLEEVVWDFQILGSAASGELEVLLVAIKADVVEGLFRTAESAGLRLQLVDVSQAALCNAFRFNYGDLDGCTMLLDIGARTSNLLFFEKGKVYSRSINIGANSITQDFASESKLPPAEAEQIKIAQGFVGLGGAYEEPENAHQAAIAKIARQVMTRLHIQINQTIQFYRNQQGGSAPDRLFLAGGASVMPYTAQFFADKLSVPVEYFNPFRNLQLDPAVPTEELEKVAHCFGEVVGLGLRNLAHCPVELNLMPKSSIQKQEFNRKKPYLIATVFSLVLVVFAYAFFYQKLAGVKESELAKLRDQTGPLRNHEASLTSAMERLNQTRDKVHQVGEWVDDRFYWAGFLTELRGAFLRTEQATRRPGLESGVWIESLAIQTDGVPPPGASGDPGADPPEMQDPAVEDPEAGTPRPSRLTAAPVAGSTNDIMFLKLVCRAINMNRDKSSPTANTDVAFALAEQLKQLPSLGPRTQLTGTMEPVADTALTFTFGVSLHLRRPIKL